MSTYAYLGYPPAHVLAVMEEMYGQSQTKYTIIQEWRYKEAFSAGNRLKAGMAWSIDQCDLIEHKLDVEKLTCNNLDDPEYATLTDIDGNIFYMSHVYSISVEEGARLRTIGKKIFSETYYLDSADIPGVTTIEEDAFARNTQMTSLNAPDVVTLKDRAFYSCGLEEFDFPSVVTVGSQALANNSNTTVIKLPYAQSIASDAFDNDYYLEEIVIGSEFYGDYTTDMFKSEFGLNPYNEFTITIQDTSTPLTEDTALIVKAVGDDTARKVSARYIQGQFVAEQDEETGNWNTYNTGTLSCMDGETIAISDVVLLSGDSGCACKIMKDQAFTAAANLLSVCVDSINTLQFNLNDWCACFTGCPELKYVSMPAVTDIVFYAFGNCPKLVSVNIPYATRIGFCAFAGCDQLQNIDLTYVTEIQSYSFESCHSLTSINFPALATINYQNEYGTQVANATFIDTGIVEYYFPCMTREYIEEYLEYLGIGIKYLEYNEETYSYSYEAFTVTIHASDETFQYTPVIEE